MKTRLLRRVMLSMLALAANLGIWTPLAGCAAEIIINEIMAYNRSVAPLTEQTNYFPDFVEFYNASGHDIDLVAERWALSTKRNPEWGPLYYNFKDFFLFPPGTPPFPADSYLLVYFDGNTNLPGIHTSFSAGGTNVTFTLGRTGDRVKLYKNFAPFIDPAPNLVDSVTFGFQLPTNSIGRVPDFTGEFTLTVPTPCGGTIPCFPNASVPFTPAPTSSNMFTLKMNEWLATNSAGWDKDWLEIYNPDTNVVSLSGLVFVDKISNLLDPVESRPVPPLSFIAPLGFVLFFCTKNSDTNRSAEELSFSISSDTVEDLFMVAGNKVTIIDKVRSDRPRRNTSQGRLPDGGDVFPGSLPNLSPEASNFVGIRPSITEQPMSRSVSWGQSASFSVTASGSETMSYPLSYQWFKDSIEMPGATNATYTIAAVTDSDAGTYFVVVTNSAGSVTSADATLTVLDTLIFATHPLTQTVGVGSNVTLSATAYGAPPLVFQWYFNGSPVGSPTTGTNVSSYTLTNVRTNQSGTYRVQVFNGYGSATSSDAALNVVVFPPSIALQPSNQNPLLGYSVTFAVSVNGTPPYRYQWQFNGADILGATNATYTIPAVAESDGGNYSVVVSNAAGSVTSANAFLWVIVPPRLGLQLLAGYPVLSLNGMLGSNFNVQYATSPASTNWLNLRSITNLSVVPFQFLDIDGSTQPARYYRAIMQ